MRQTRKMALRAFAVQSFDRMQRELAIEGLRLIVAPSAESLTRAYVVIARPAAAAMYDALTHAEAYGIRAWADANDGPVGAFIRTACGWKKTLGQAVTTARLAGASPVYLWALRRDGSPLDGAVGFVVAAPDEATARGVPFALWSAANAVSHVVDGEGCQWECGHVAEWEGAQAPCVWRDPERTSCERIGATDVDREVGVVLRAGGSS